MVVFGLMRPPLALFARVAAYGSSSAKVVRMKYKVLDSLSPPSLAVEVAADLPSCTRLLVLRPGMLFWLPVVVVVPTKLLLHQCAEVQIPVETPT
jgi:hypothetical protein